MNKIVYAIPKWFWFYIVWLVVATSLVFWQYGFSNQNITRSLVIFYFGLTLLYAWSQWKFSKKVSDKNSKTFFILSCIFSAALVEGFYLISEPLFPSFLITPGMEIGQIIKNFFIDLAFTVPLYFVLFRITWFFINKYNYTIWQFVFIFALSHALGDGGHTFFFQPGLLLFIPYIMTNYHAVNVAPYLVIKENIKKENLSNSKFGKIFTPLVVIPLTYLFFGIIIAIVGSILGFR